MQYGILQRHSSLISFFNHLMDLLCIPLALMFMVISSGVLEQSISILICGFVTTLCFQFIANTRGFYMSMRGESLALEVFKGLRYWVLSFLFGFFVFATLEGGFKEQMMPLLGGWFLICCLYFITSRVSLRLILRFYRKKGFNQRRVVIVGASEAGLRLAENIIKLPRMGLRLVGFYSDLKYVDTTVANTHVPILGGLEQVVSDARGNNIDRVYIALKMKHDKYIQQVVSELADTTCSVIFVPDVFSFELLNARMSHINGMPVISIYDTPMEGANRLVKRIQDIVISSIILLLISPVLLAISVAIKLSSPGPVFFKQHRYGIDGKPINVWKFRSMTAMDNGDKVVQATKNDVRITPLGAFLRRTSLDELPQFINVLQGGMSIVGPRPHAVAHNEEYRKLIDGYMLRHKVKPGITGWAQINGWRGETDTLEKMQKRIDYDHQYISNWSLSWDLKIIFMTIFKGFVNKNAY
ncbi:undecaprenyl-phosphate glucose phosphotransferase [Thalassotalea litorea]|uniref:undecaprenyl-phosphate glucose phosphotransferase n=1 Tax=Thalassotalea litorea TaxID=2020715 RepID=UPI003735B21C